MIYRCAICEEEVTVKDNIGNGLVTVNVDGCGLPAHRKCAEDEYANHALPSEFGEEGDSPQEQEF